MFSAPDQAVFSVTRAAMVRHYAEIFEALGVPVKRLLANTAIQPEVLEVTDSVVPLESAFKFAELACRSLQTEHLGLSVGLNSSLSDLDSYGRILQTATTLGEYLNKGVALYSTLTTGERFWLSQHGPNIRLNIKSPGEVGLGMYQSHLCTISVTIAACRKAIGPAWSPDEIGLCYKSREKIPPIDLLAESRIVTNCPHSYINIPQTALGLRLPQNIQDGHQDEGKSIHALPENLVGLATQQIKAFIADGRRFRIDSVSESLAVSKRALQRAFSNEGITYFQLLSEIRFRRARSLLDQSDMPVTDIAIELGYTDASNFARAFRQHIGISPRAFRDAAIQSAKGLGS